MYGFLLCCLWLCDNPPLALTYPQLPPARVCATMCRICEQDVRRINEFRESLGAGYANEFILQRYDGLLEEARRVRNAWDCAYYLTAISRDERWTCFDGEEYRMVNQGRMCPDHHEEWSEDLIRLIGHDAFWRGELPLPLSMRGR